MFPLAKWAKIDSVDEYKITKWLALIIFEKNIHNVKLTTS